MAAMERVARGDAMDAVGGTVLFFLGGYITHQSGLTRTPVGSRGGIAVRGAGLATGVWMIRVGLLGASKRSEGWLRHLVSGAVAALLLWAPLNALEVVLGPAEFVVSIAAFFLTEFLIQRWIGRTIRRQVEAGVADELSGG